MASAGRSKDLRTLMREKTSISAVNETKERVRLLKQARSQELHSSKTEGNRAASESNLTASASLERRKIEETAVVKKQTKVVTISNLLRTTSDTEQIKTAQRPILSAEPNGAELDAEIVTESSPRYSVDVAPVIAGASHTVPDSSMGNGSLPAGFFDDPREDMVARGLNVKEEIKKKEKEQEDILNQFLGEVQTIVGADESTDNIVDDQGKEDEEEQLEHAIQLAYSAKAAAFMANIERSMKTSNQEINQVVTSGEAVSTVEIDNILQETVGLKRGYEDNNMINDVMQALLKKKQKLVENTVTRYVDENEEAGDSGEEDEDEYTPLDYTDWHSRGM